MITSQTQRLSYCDVLFGRANRELIGAVSFQPSKPITRPYIFAVELYVELQF